MKNNIIDAMSVLFCFILFAVSMFSLEQSVLFVLLGITGLSGVWYFVFRMVNRVVAN